MPKSSSLEENTGVEKLAVRNEGEANNQAYIMVAQMRSIENGNQVHSPQRFAPTTVAQFMPFIAQPQLQSTKNQFYKIPMQTSQMERNASPVCRTPAPITSFPLHLHQMPSTVTQ